jgi:uncharacterized protein YaaW (UPF0174 family)
MIDWKQNGNLYQQVVVDQQMTAERKMDQQQMTERMDQQMDGQMKVTMLVDLL